MTDIEKSFASVAPPEPTSSGTEVEVHSTAKAAQESEDVEEVASVPYVVKAPRANSKLILQNMEEVLNSVKKKHRQKHRRKREQKKLAQMEADAAATAGDRTEAHKSSHHRTERRHHHHHHHHHKRPKPLQEKTAQENGLDALKTKAKHRESKSPLKTMTTTNAGSILKHFPRTPKKDEAALEQPPTSDTKSAKPANAFEVMMNARNKTIGSNTPGKEVSPTSAAQPDEVAEVSAKRKLMLQEWADRKGGAKRKLVEEARAAFVEKELTNRAKKFKQMLINGCSPKASSSNNNSSNLTPDKSAERRRRKSASKTVDTGAEKSPDKKSKRRNRKRRLSSVDLVEVRNVSQTRDTETEDFLAKLSSPTKKRDSLLGYFPKRESPKGLADTAPAIATLSDETTVSTPKGRPRRSTAKRQQTAEVKEVGDGTRNEVMVEHSPALSGRPRRSCAGKARYDYDLEMSPSKMEKSKRTACKPQPTPKASTPVSEIISLDDSNSSITPQQTPRKLAPLFVRVMPKPTPDPEMLKARHQFLMSGVPEKMRLEMVKQKQYEHSYEETVELFPHISHVQQLSAEEAQLVHELKPITFKLRACEVVETASLTATKRKSRGKAASTIGNITDCQAADFAKGSKEKPKRTHLLPVLENKRDIIKEWKSDFGTFPTYKCYNQMREKYRYFSAIDSAQDTQQVTESFVVTRRTRRSLEAQKRYDPEAAEERPPPTAPNGELLFTEKYKPLLFEQVLVNVAPVMQLREFLSSWSNGNSASASARNSQTLDDSVDFLDDSSSSSHQVTSNSVVLLGPVSSGKTNAVFALANELNFNVLEINAGMKRTGKRLIQELQEATQSHQIRKEGSAGHSKMQKNLLKMSLNGLSAKSNKATATPQSSNDAECSKSSTTSSDLNQSVRKCLILIEDADIVFDQMDAGFVDAIYTLAASSKRPVIMIATNPNCQHLQRLMQQNTINFMPPNAINISKFLAVLSLMENCPISLDDLVSLYFYNNQDVRKTLHELQFFIQSGGDRNREAAQLSIPKQLTPQKHDAGKQAGVGEFFASPGKRRLVEEGQQQVDEQLGKHKEKEQKRDATKPLYTHRAFFEFYTQAQNEKYRIPFPVDFRLLSTNLGDIFQASPKLLQQQVIVEHAAAVVRRKSRSPKKTWLSTVVSADKIGATSPLDALCNFYENVSIAAVLGASRQELRCKEVSTTYFGDRLVPHAAEDIAHELVERAIAVDLGAAACPYNLFDTPKQSHFLCDVLEGISACGQRARNLDFEPALRSICRSEQLRATHERRSTRFYHYLRNSLAIANVCSFSTENFEVACDVFQEPSITLEEQ